MQVEVMEEVAFDSAARRTAIVVDWTVAVEDGAEGKWMEREM